MDNYHHDIIEHIETHFLEGIRTCFENGVNPNYIFRGEPLIYELTSEYTRSPRFKDCARLFVDFGLVFEDKALLFVLLNDPAMLREEIKAGSSVVDKRYTLRCAYTPLYEVTLLHICAEFNQVECATELVKNGADINARAGLDEYGFGGQTPIFHTVNQNSNQSAEMLEFLLNKNADLEITVKGFTWGKGYAWETFIPAVNPVSYAMMGLLPQMHRNEKTIADTVAILLKHAYNIDFYPPNIPNHYLK